MVSNTHEAMKIHQIKVEFVAEQDRLLISVLTDSAKEVLIYLTRRCVRRLWPLLIEMAGSSLSVAAQASPEARAAVLEFQHEQAVRQADFSRPYAEGPRERPLGSEPILAARIQTRKDSSGNHVLTMLPARGAGVHLTLDEPLLHSFCKLLQDAVVSSEWDLALELPRPMASRLESDEARTIN